MSKAEIICKATLHVKCPTCGESEGFRIDPLPAGIVFGPWYCDKCGEPISGVRTPEGADLWPPSEKNRNKKVKTVNLLRMHLKDQNIFLVVEGSRHEPEPDPPKHSEWISPEYATREGAANRHVRYFYNESTCPTNICRDVLMVIDDSGERDPHGIFRYVGRCDVTDPKFRDTIGCKEELPPEIEALIERCKLGDVDNDQVF